MYLKAVIISSIAALCFAYQPHMATVWPPYSPYYGQQQWWPVKDYNYPEFQYHPSNIFINHPYSPPTNIITQLPTCPPFVKFTPKPPSARRPPSPPSHLPFLPPSKGLTPPRPSNKSPAPPPTNYQQPILPPSNMLIPPGLSAKPPAPPPSNSRLPILPPSNMLSPSRPSTRPPATLAFITELPTISPSTISTPSRPSTRPPASLAFITELPTISPSTISTPSRPSMRPPAPLASITQMPTLSPLTMSTPPTPPARPPPPPLLNASLPDSNESYAFGIIYPLETNSTTSPAVEDPRDQNRKSINKRSAFQQKDNHNIPPISRAPFSFYYYVKDKDNDYAHGTFTDGNVVHGEYHVQLPDGRLQLVKYIADSAGFHADVTYESQPRYPKPSNSFPVVKNPPYEPPPYAHEGGES